MNRTEFHRHFGSNNVIVLPVIHVLNHRQTALNIDKLISERVSGCFLINHDFKINRFLPIIRSIRRIYPEFWIGVNFLAVTGQTAFPILASLQREGYRVDAYWADDACIDERVEKQVEANLISKIRKDCEWQGLYFGGTAFKKQRPIAPKNFGISAEIAANIRMWLLLLVLRQEPLLMLVSWRFFALHFQTHR